MWKYPCAQAVCLLLFLAHPAIAANIIVTPSTATLAVGQTVDLNASVANVTWGSSNSAVATVNTTTGLVTARGLGTATIQAKYKGDRGYATITVRAPCTFSVSPTSIYAGAAEANLTLTITASSSTCAWTATSPVSWVTLSKTGATGSTTIGVRVLTNTGTSGRSTTLTIAGRAIPVTQEAAAPTLCTYQLTPTSETFPSGGGITTETVTTQAGCTWTAASDQPWATVTPTAATASGTVTLTVAENTETTSRSATLTIAGRTIAVTQEAAVTAALCDLSLIGQTTLAPGAYRLLSCLSGPIPDGWKTSIRFPDFTDQVVDLGHLYPEGPANSTGLTPYYLPFALTDAGQYQVSSIAYNYNPIGGWAQTASTNALIVNIQ